MTLPEFLLAAEGFHQLEEVRQQAHWERTRWLATLTLSPHTKKGHSIKPTDLAIFPWEKQKKKKGRNQLLKNALKKMTDGQA
jgi:hypothetical protein